MIYNLYSGHNDDSGSFEYGIAIDFKFLKIYLKYQ